VKSRDKLSTAYSRRGAPSGGDFSSFFSHLAFFLLICRNRVVEERRDWRMKWEAEHVKWGSLIGVGKREIRFVDG
jgi:hypothetical protein